MKILVIRRDNIGDLVCTTPLFSSLRHAFPTAYIAALVNTYSAPVLANNPEIDDVFAYTKGKHGANQGGKIQRFIATFRLLSMLRKHHFDVIIAIGKSSVTLAKLISPKRVISAADPAGGDVISLKNIEPLHAVEAVHKYLAPLGIHSAPGRMTIYPDIASQEIALAPSAFVGKPVIGLHLSARKPSQRWPHEYFSKLATKLHAELGASFLVFWSPGTESNVLHPGDDEKAERFKLATNQIPVRLCPTGQLDELITAMSLCDLIICGDGGAMHIGAGLGKPVVALFGDSDPQRWRPWKVPCRVFQPMSHNVVDITVDEVFDAALALLEKATSVEKTAS
jgi:ADP-heptose:LPS heptosyltransferase